MDTIRPELNASEFQIYLTLIRKSWARNQDFLQVSISELARETSLAVMTVKTALRSLANKKLVKVAAKQTNNSSRSYKIFRPQELQYYNEAFNKIVNGQNRNFNRASSILNQSRSTDFSPETGAPTASSFIYPRLDPEDREAFNVISRNLSQNEILNYQDQALEFFREKGVSASDEEVLWCRNDLIFKTYAGPLRVEKYL